MYILLIIKGNKMKLELITKDHKNRLECYPTECDPDKCTPKTGECLPYCDPDCNPHDNCEPYTCQPGHHK